MINKLKDIQFVAILRGSTVESSCFAPRERGRERETGREKTQKRERSSDLELGPGRNFRFVDLQRKLYEEKYG
jgi:hypothetical protein